ncbi:response regulator receiver domain protein [gamma proteobacterium HTCC5015]|nr:response regulator receiver domain protein [gamma proteobacterium HTCC5015]
MDIKKVLVVDDSEADLGYIQTIVKDAGYETITAVSGSEAIRIAKSQKPDLIFMDIIMDGTDGYEACRTLHRDPETKDIPVIFVSSKNQKADRIWAELQGGKGYVTKPAEPDQLMDQIESLKSK